VIEGVACVLDPPARERTAFGSSAERRQAGSVGRTDDAVRRRPVGGNGASSNE
jgi:hypothetical protein